MIRRLFVARTKTGAFVAGKAIDDVEALDLLHAWHPRENMEGAEVLWGAIALSNQQLVFTRGGPID